VASGDVDAIVETLAALLVRDLIEHPPEAIDEQDEKDKPVAA
jgi:hypothetical protein